MYLLVGISAGVNGGKKTAVVVRGTMYVKFGGRTE